MRVSEAGPVTAVAQPTSVDKASDLGVDGTGVARQIFAADGKTLPPPEQVLPQQPPAADLSRLAEQISRQMQSMSRQLKFSVNREVDRTVVQVTNPETGETVRQIPSEEFIALAEALRTASEESLRGLLYDREV
jgi:uncharacterized FlaG/YvyC family protein